MSIMGSRPVVVGVDHSGDGEAAVNYAAGEARRRGVGLCLVHGFVVPPTPVGTPNALYDDNALLMVNEEPLSGMAARLRREFPDLTITTKVVAGSGGFALVQESADAELVVVGPRGRGGFPDLRLGSVAEQVVAHARCPVVVVRDHHRKNGDGRVLVGIDGTEASEDVLAFAFDQAATRDVPLVCVHVWSVPQMSAISVGTVWSRNPVTAQAQLQEAAERVSAEALARWQEKYPEVAVKRWTVHGDDPGRALLDAAWEMSPDLIVVGSRGQGAITGLVHGSVSRKVAHSADVSVAVVHASAPVR
jgi:nucleotide-binding universal stress UspA family protein